MVEAAQAETRLRGVICVASKDAADARDCLGVQTCKTAKKPRLAKFFRAKSRHLILTFMYSLRTLSLERPKAYIYIKRLRNHPVSRLRMRGNGNPFRHIR